MSVRTSMMVAAWAAAMAGGAGCSPEKKPTKDIEDFSMNPRPVVVMETSFGTIKIELRGDKAPISAANFLRYVDNGHYDGTIFHRVIPTFMIQGGGFRPDMTEKPAGDPIVNESANGLTNDLGTVAMARTRDPNSATSQFFINVTANNSFLNRAEARDGVGYAVFGKVIEGMDVVKRIRDVPTHTVNVRGRKLGDVPVEPVLIKSVRRAPKTPPATGARGG